MKCQIDLEIWPVEGCFTISRGPSTESFVLYLRITDGELVAHGESEAHDVDAASARRTVDAARAALAALGTDLQRDRLQQQLPPGALRNALDCALWDLEAKRAGRRAWELAGIDERPISTVFTLSLDTPQKMAAAAAAHRDWPWLKIKLGGGTADLGRLQAIREAAPGPHFLVDANGGWTIVELNDHAQRFEALGVAAIEQPLPPGEDIALRDYHGAIPLCADESCTDRVSLARLPAGYRYINIKLDKTGGLTEALALQKMARERGYGVMVGCNLGTSLAMAPALLIAAGADIVDLDGPLLLARDRAPALRYDRNHIHWPEPLLWG